MAQLQARYPNASLIAEFVTVHQEHLVVRALVQVGGIPLATGMAAATDIEQAEDRAKIRALAALGIGGFATSASPQSSTHSISPATSLPPSHFSPPSNLSSANLALSDASIAATPSEDVPQLSTSLASGVSASASGSSDIALTQPSTSSSTSHFQPLPSSDPAQSEVIPSPLPVPELPMSELPNVTNSADFSASFATRNQTEFSDPESSNPEFDRTEYEFSYEPEEQPDRYEPDMNLHSEVGSISESGLPSLDSIETTPPISKPASSAEPTKATATGKGKTTKRKAENTEIAPSTAGENDRSEEIARIGLEMKRLGWTTEQGRNYLKRTYGKRSRQELDDSELIDFLRYLEAQVSPSESPF